jgi:hypothetical protein
MPRSFVRGASVYSSYSRISSAHTFTLQVKEVDLVRAGDLVEKARGLPGG